MALQVVIPLTSRSSRPAGRLGPRPGADRLGGGSFSGDDHAGRVLGASPVGPIEAGTRSGRDPDHDHEQADVGPVRVRSGAHSAVLRVTAADGTIHPLPERFHANDQVRSLGRRRSLARVSTGLSDYWTQGETLEDLEVHLRDLYEDLTSGKPAGVRKVGGVIP